MGVDASIFSAAEIAAATAAVVTIDVSLDMAKLAKKHAEIYRDKDAHYNAIFRQDAEQSYVNEIWALPVPTHDFNGQISSAIQINPLVGPMPGSVNMRRAVDAYEYSDLIMWQARLYTDLMEYMLAFERERVRIEEIRRWEYRTNVVDMGLGVAADVRDRLSNGLSINAVVSDAKASWASGISNELGAIAGFRRRLSEEVEVPPYQLDAPSVGRVRYEVPDVSPEVNRVVFRRP